MTLKNLAMIIVLILWIVQLAQRLVADDASVKAIHSVGGAILVALMLVILLIPEPKK